MRGDDERAGVLGQRRLDPLQRGHVEVAGRLVEQQQVGPAGDQRRQGQLGALAVAQLVHPPVDLVAAEEELVEEGPRLVLVPDDLGPEEVQHRPRARRGVAAVLLRQVADPHAVAGADLAAGRGRWGELPGQGAQQRALAAAVGADDRQAVAAVDLQVDPAATVAEDRRRAVGDAQAARDDGKAPVGQRALGQVAQVEALGVLRALDPLLRGQVAFQAALLGLGLLGDALGDLAVVEVDCALLGVQGFVLQRGDLALERGDPLGLVLVARLLLLALPPLRLDVGAVVASVGCQAVRLGVEFEDRAGGAVEEAAVVRDDNCPVWTFGDEALQPEERRQVEVVGRLVEQQDRRLGQQQPRQREARLLPAAERGDNSPPVERAEAEPVGDHLGPPLDLVAAQRLESLDRGGVGGEHFLPRFGRRVGRGERRRQRVQVGAGGGQFGVGPAQRLVHRARQVLLGVLLQVADAVARPERDRAAVGPQPPGDDLQEGALAAAVRPDQPDLLAAVEDEGDVLQHRAVREPLGKAGNFQHGRSSPTGRGGGGGGRPGARSRCGGVARRAEGGCAWDGS